jgi:hypothetical protein
VGVTVAVYNAEKSKKLFEDIGYHYIRSSYRMLIEMDGPVPEPIWPEGITLRIYNAETDAEAVCRAEIESFRDHFGFVEMPFEEAFKRFKHFEVGYEGFDPTLVFLAMDGEEIGKVSCQDCGSMHKFNNPLDVHKVRMPQAIKDGEAATAETAWAAGLLEAKRKERDYSMASKYRVGDIVNHRTFGRGVVIKLHANKCDMLFKDGERLMASTNQ